MNSFPSGLCLQTEKDFVRGTPVFDTRLRYPCPTPGLNGVAKQHRPLKSRLIIQTRETSLRTVVSEFKFKNIEALNAALNVLMPDSTGVSHTFFSLNDQVLQRKHNHRSELGSSLADKDDEGSGEFLKSMKYKINVKGPRVTASGAGDEVEVTEVSKKEVHVATNFKVIAEDPDALNMRFSMQK